MTVDIRTRCRLFLLALFAPVILARSYLNISMEDLLPEKKETESISLFDDLPQEEELLSRCAEAAVTLLVGEKVQEELKELKADDLYFKIEEPLIKVLSGMERAGVRIDMGQLRKYSSSLASEMNGIQERVREMAQEPDLNIMSPKQIGILLFEKLKLDSKVKPKSGVRYSYYQA